MTSPRRMRFLTRNEFVFSLGWSDVASKHEVTTGEETQSSSESGCRRSNWRITVLQYEERRASSKYYLFFYPCTQYFLEFCATKSKGKSLMWDSK